MTVEYYIKYAYGKDRLYVKDKEQARYITAITDRLTIDDRLVACFEFLGVKFKQVVAPRKEK